MKRKMLVMGALTAVAMSLVLGGCSNGGTAGSTANTTSNSASDKTRVSVGIGNVFVPFCYLDDDENPAGYDYEVIRLVGEKLSDKYEFVIGPDDFANLLIGLDTKKYDVAIHHFGYTDERAEKYLYADEADMYFGSFHVGYKKGRTDITDLKSAAGLTAVTSSGTQSESILLNWNKENPDHAVKIEYGTGQTVIASGIENGLYDIYVESKYDLDLFNSQYNDVLEYGTYNVTPEGYNDGAYFIYRKGLEELQQDIDGALSELREEGVLSQLSIEYLGEDYAVRGN